MSEETKRPARDIPIGLVGSMSMITVIYCLVALALTMVVKYTQIDINAAYSVAFEQICMKWAKYLVSVSLAISLQPTQNFLVLKRYSLVCFFFSFSA
ncbi:hypothetical protein Pint_00816 [Pistacia integerrima]|uniref:Uncharacterized protein n=1 Tax=Pistacia integerrima TaxID=434235 RepID=A0ACC0ZQC3_9ROSI|nr:hypothetical protein Pint_00816 [Pistacia integerrima]